jgi:hypothetical protein
MKRILLTAVILMNGLLLYAQSVDEIIDRADAMFELDKVYSRSTMTVYRSGKADPPQIMEGYNMEKDGKDSTLTIILAPERVKGTAYLQIENDLWVRFSSTGRVRKMSSSAKKGSASGSDFSYSDIGEGNKSFSEKYDYSLEGTEKIDGQECYKVTFLPKPDEQDNTYQKLVAYISKEDYLYLRIDYYEDSARIKYLILSDYGKLGQCMYPRKMAMKSLVKDSESVIVTDVIEYDSAKVQDRYFTTEYLSTIH